MSRDEGFELDLQQQRVLFGAGRVDDVPAEVDALGLRAVVLIATASAKGAADQLSERLGTQVVARVHEVVQHVPTADVTSTTEVATTAGADGIVTVGGGSATGLGKAVAVGAGLPLVAIPTTYAGSEATTVYGVTGEHKRTARDVRALPRVVVYDAELTTGMPRRLTATSGLNALAHCVEALYAPGANPVTDLLAQEGARQLAVSLPVAVEAPPGSETALTARGEALYGTYLAGWSMEQAGTALHHTLCHVIGGTYRVDHGEVHAVLLPYVAAYNAHAAPAALALVALALGAPDAVLGLRSLAERLDAPTDLASIGLPADVLDEVTERAVAAVGARNPRPPDAPSLRRLLDDAYAGRPPGTY
jgi:alcohol dehydrogenase class IV